MARYRVACIWERDPSFLQRVVLLNYLPEDEWCMAGCRGKCNVYIYVIGCNRKKLLTDCVEVDINTRYNIKYF
jgi:hypothetical protein